MDRKAQLYQHHLSSVQLQQINLICLEDNATDQLMFKHSNNGKFTVKAYLEQIQTHRPHTAWNHLVWNSSVPFRLNAFFWRVVNNAISVDVNIKAKGINLVSKCHCCQNGAEDFLILAIRMRNNGLAILCSNFWET